MAREQNTVNRIPFELGSVLTEGCQEVRRLVAYEGEGGCISRKKRALIHREYPIFIVETRLVKTPGGTPIETFYEVTDGWDEFCAMTSSDVPKQKLIIAAKQALDWLNNSHGKAPGCSKEIRLLKEAIEGVTGETIKIDYPMDDEDA